MTDEAAPQRGERGRWLPGQSGNPYGGGSRAAIEARKRIAERAQELVDMAIGLALQGDTTALRMCLDRLSPPLKPAADTIEVAGLAEAPDMKAKAERILAAVAAGELGPDAGTQLIQALAGLAQLTELADLKQRLEQLEEQQR
jgi:hypothetical protein